MANEIYDEQAVQAPNPAEQQTAAAQQVQEDEERRGFWTKGRALLAGGVAVVALTAVGIGGCNYLQDDDGSAPTTTKDANEQCDDLTQANAAANSDNYNTPQAFFPKTGKLEKADQVRPYIQELFSEDGPLAGKGDYASLAAIMSTVVLPAHDGAVTDINFNYLGTYNARIAAYGAEGGKKAAVADCKQAWETLNQVAGYNDNWAQEGEQVTEFQAVRDTTNPDKSKQNNIVGMTLSQGVSTDTLRGIEFKLRNTSKELDGFQEILLSTNQKGQLDGRIFVRGFTNGNVSLDPNGEPQVSIDQNGNPVQVRLLPDGTVETTTVNKDTGETSVTVGPNEGVNNTGGAAGPNGLNPEAGPGGVTDSPAVGPSTPQGPGTTTPGTTPPGTNPPTTRPPVTTPPTTQPPVTAPPTTRPPVTTPPTTQPPVTTPTTTQPKGPEVTIPGAPN